MPSQYKNYSIEQLKQAVSKSLSIRQTLIEIGIAPQGGNYASIKKIIKSNQINTEHFTGMLWNKGKTTGPKRPIEDYLSNNHSITSHKLRLRLLIEGIFPHKCMNCFNTEWLGQPIPLELEHKNGKHEDNSLANLQLLCPNCHTLTPTYRGKNKKK